MKRSKVSERTAIEYLSRLLSKGADIREKSWRKNRILLIESRGKHFNLMVSTVLGAHYDKRGEEGGQFPDI